MTGARRVCVVAMAGAVLIAAPTRADVTPPDLAPEVILTCAPSVSTRVITQTAAALRRELGLPPDATSGITVLVDTLACDAACARARSLGPGRVLSVHVDATLDDVTFTFALYEAGAADPVRAGARVVADAPLGAPVHVGVQQVLALADARKDTADPRAPAFSAAFLTAGAALVVSGIALDTFVTGGPPLPARIGDSPLPSDATGPVLIGTGVVLGLVGIIANPFD